MKEAPDVSHYNPIPTVLSILCGIEDWAKMSESMFGLLLSSQDLGSSTNI